MDLISTYFWSFRFLKAVVKADEDGESCNSIIDPLGQGSCDRQFASLLLLTLRRQFIFYFFNLLCRWSGLISFYITTTSTITHQMTSFEIQSKSKIEKRQIKLIDWNWNESSFYTYFLFSFIFSIFFFILLILIASIIFN